MADGIAESTYRLLLQENELANQLGQDPSTARSLVNFIPSKAGELFRKPYSPPFTSVNPPDLYWFSFVRDFIFYVAGVPTRQIIIGVSNNTATFLYKWVSGGTITALPNGAYSPPHNAAAGWIGDPLLRYSDGLLYISDGSSGSNGTVYDGTATWKWSSDVPAVPVLFSLTAVVGIGAVTFTGAGLNDMTAGGQFMGGADADFDIVITATGTPDTFKWRIGAGAYTTGVQITGAAQTLARGITVTFAATTGHTVNDLWEFTCQGLFIDSFVEYVLTEYDSTYKRESAPGPRLRVTPEAAGYYDIHLSWPARVNKAPGGAADWTAGYADKFRVYRSQLDGSTQLYRLLEVSATDSAQSDAATDTSPFYGDELYTMLPIQPPFRNQKPRPSLVGAKCVGRFALRDETRRSRLWMTGLKEILAQLSFTPGLETTPGSTNQALVETGDEKKINNLSDFENFVELANEQFQIRAMLWFRDALMLGTERDVVLMFGRNPEDPYEVSNTSTYSFGVFGRNSFLVTTHGLVIFTADRKLMLDPAFGAGGGDRTAQVEDIGWPKQPQFDKTDIQYSNRFQMEHYKFGRDRDWLVITYTTQNAIDGGRAHMLIYDFSVRGWITFDDINATCIGIVQEDQGYQFLVAGGSVAGGTGAAGEDRKLRVVIGYSSDATTPYAAAATRLGLPAAGTDTRPANLYRSAMLDLGSPEFWKLWERISYYKKLGTPDVLVKYWGDPSDMDTLTASFMAAPSFWTAGNGLNDLTSSGTFTGADGSTFEIEITTAGAPDTFKWRKNEGAYTTGVAITGAAQALSDGISVTFAATTGHTVGDKWTLGASEVLSLAGGAALSTNEFRLWINRNRKQQAKRAVVQFSLAAGGADGALDGLEIKVLPKGSDTGRL